MIGRGALWCLTVFLAALGGAVLHEAAHASNYGLDRGIETFFGLLCTLTAAAIYVRRLR